ncbi:DUF5677 domain-containing protein [bacterium]|nr:DUF5677 domain-containing protein [bacterium]
MEDVIRKYDSIFENYMASLDIEQTLNIGTKKYGDIFNLLDQCYHLGGWLTNQFYNNSFRSDWLNGFYILFNRHLKALLSISKCLRYGCPVESTLIVRSLFENLLNFRICIEDPDGMKERFRLYSNFLHILRWQWISKADIQNRKPPVNDEQRERYRKNYEKYKDDYFHTNPKFWAWKVLAPKTSKNYSPNVLELAKKYDLECFYYSIYQTGSEVSHASPIALNLMSEGDMLSAGPTYTHLSMMIAAIVIIFSKDYYDFTQTILSNYVGNDFVDYFNQKFYCTAAYLYLQS